MPNNDSLDSSTLSSQDSSTQTLSSQQVPQDALQLGPRRKAYAELESPTPLRRKTTDLLFHIRRSTDPLVHNGRHFGRSIHALCNVYALIHNGIIRMGERSEEPEEAFTAQ